MTKQPLSFRQLVNMSVGFLGIQFGWSLQMANTSAIFEYLGAQPEQIPILWLAAPMTGLMVQPVIGALSDRTWTVLGRRRPYFLGGAIAASLALIAMPNASALWMAVAALWILDTAANVSMEPFRAFVSDLLPTEQHTRGYATQSLFIGLGAVLAYSLPWCLGHLPIALPSVLPSLLPSDGGHIPATTQISFYIGAVVFLSAILWTVCTTQEEPPEDLEPLPKGGLGGTARTIFEAIQNMPATMQQLIGVQFFSWVALFCVFLYLPTAIAHHIFGAALQSSPSYAEGIQWAGLCLAVADGTCCLFSLLLAPLALRLGATVTHALCLGCGAIALMSLVVIPDQFWLFLPMVGFGIAKASILTIPYAILSDELSIETAGIYMGIFNIFIVIPQIVSALALGWMMSHIFGDNQLYLLAFGGVSMLIAATFALRVKMPLAPSESTLPEMSS